MPTFQITLSEPQQQFIQRRVAELGLDSTDQYFDQLLKEDWEKKRDEYYLKKCQEGIASGQVIPITPGYWEELKARTRQRHESRQKKEAM